MDPPSRQNVFWASTTFMHALHGIFLVGGEHEQILMYYIGRLDLLCILLLLYATYTLSAIFYCGINLR